MNNTYINNSSNSIDEIKLYALSFLSIAFSGFPFFTHFKWKIILFFIITVFLFIWKKKKIDIFFHYYILFLIIILMIQSVTFRFFSLNTTLGVLMTFSLPYLLIKIIGEKFIKHYISILTFFCIFSLTIYIPTILSDTLKNFIINQITPIFTEDIQGIYSPNPNLIFYTFDPVLIGKIYRNSGPFWEAGAFAGYLNIALFLNTLINKNVMNKTNLILVTGIISTFSTTGYILLFINIIIMSYSRYGLKSLIFVPLFLLIGFISYNKVEFLGSKIEEQTFEANHASLNSVRRSRFVSAALDIKDIKENPFFGRGRNKKTRFENNSISSDIMNHRNNDTTNFAVKFGLLFYFFFFFNMFRSFYNLSGSLSLGIVGVAVVLVFGYSQTIFQYPFFIMLTFLHIEIIKRKTQVQTL